MKPTGEIWIWAVALLKQVEEYARYHINAGKSEYEKSHSWLQEQFPDATFPTLPELKDKKEILEQRKTVLQTKYQYYKDFEKDPRTVQTNVDAILPPVAATKDRSKTPKAETS